LKTDQTSGIHLWLVLWKAYESLRRHAEKHIASLPLGMSEFAILEGLLHKGPLPVNTIGAKVRLTSGSASVAIDRLEKKGLVERRNHPRDRRTRVVHLTAQGRKLIQSAFADHTAAMEQAAAGLSRRERAELLQLLKKLGFSAEKNR
jgi:MarR family 2-MHQ and catechol resistance regulon transcriptional repressor